MGDWRDPLRWAIGLVATGLGPGIILGAVLSALVMTCSVRHEVGRLEAQKATCEAARIAEQVRQHDSIGAALGGERDFDFTAEEKARGE